MVDHEHLRSAVLKRFLPTCAAAVALLLVAAARASGDVPALIGMAAVECALMTAGFASGVLLLGSGRSGRRTTEGWHGAGSAAAGALAPLLVLVAAQFVPAMSTTGTAAASLCAGIAASGVVAMRGTLRRRRVSV